MPRGLAKATQPSSCQGGAGARWALCGHSRLSLLPWTFWPETVPKRGVAVGAEL